MSTWVTPAGLTWMGWYLTAYTVWVKLTKAQRRVLTGGKLSAVVVKKLIEMGLWDDKPTPWGAFVAAIGTDQPTDGFVLDAAGNLCVVLP